MSEDLCQISDSRSIVKEKKVNKYEFVLAYADKLAELNNQHIGDEGWLMDELSKLSDYAYLGEEDIEIKDKKGND